MLGRSVLIVGNGIAGPALAHWLLHYGFSATIVERAPRPRSEGYIIDFWGLGYDIVERMGVLPDVLKASYHISEVRLVGRSGARRGGFNAEVFRELTAGRYTSLPRAALSDILYESVAHRSRTWWNDTPVAFEPRASGVFVEFRSGRSEVFDVVVGADGLHSSVRRLLFGESTSFERFLGFQVAAFETAGYQPRDEGVYASHGTPGRQVARFSMRDDRTMFLLVAAGAATQVGSAPAKAFLRAQFSSMGWEVPQILAAMEGCDEIYFDRVSQIRLPCWSRGGVGLLGDAAYAPSLLAGQGSALAIIGAYVLAGELSHAVTAEGAFERYESRLRDFIVAKQDAAVKLAPSFARASQVGMWLRDLATLAFRIPGVAKLAMGRSLTDDWVLPEYPAPEAAAASGETTS